MNNFTIKDIELLSGIKAHTLRIWEQRHGLCFSKRKKSLHRYYDNEDLKQILRISYLYHLGYKISKIALLSVDDINTLATSNIKPHEYDKYINLMIESSLDYDQAAFEKITHTAFLHLGFEQTVLNVFYPYMEKIGLLWVTDHVIPAQEHFSSYLIQKEIILATDKLNNTAVDNITILIFSPEGERHEIPLLVTRYLFKKQRIKTIYFGVDTSLDELRHYCSCKKVTHLYCHKVINFLHKKPEDFIHCMQEKFPNKKILLSGPALHHHINTSKNVQVLHSIDELQQILKVMVSGNDNMV